MAFLFDGFPEANLSVRRYAFANFDGYCQHVLQMDSVLKCMEGTSLGVQSPGLCAPNSGGLGSIPGQETRPHVPQLRPGTTKEIYILKYIHKLLESKTQSILFISRSTAPKSVSCHVIDTH